MSKRNSRLSKFMQKYIKKEFQAVKAGEYVPTAKGKDAQRRQIIAIGMSKGRKAYRRSLGRK